MSDLSRTERVLRDWLAEADLSPSAERVVDDVLMAVPGISQESASRSIVAARRIGAGLMAAAAVAVAIVGLSVLTVMRPPTGPGGSPSTAVSPSLPASVAPSPSVPGVSVIDMHIDTWALAVDERSVWVQIGEAGIGRIDRATNTDSGARAAEVPYMQFEGSDLWALDLGTGITRLDPISGSIEQTIPGISGYYLLVDGTTAWVTDTGHSLDRVDLTTGKVVTTVDVPATPKEMTLFDGAVWVACDGAGSIARVDVRTNRVVATIPAGERPANVAAGEGAVWVWNHEQQVLRIDPATNKVVATIDGVAEGPGAGLAVGGGFVWVALPNGIGKVDPSTNRIVDVIPLGPGGYVDFAWFDGELWVSSTNLNLVFRVDPRP